LPAPPAIKPAYGVLFDVASRELDAQLGSADALDAKAATVFSVASTVAVVVPALLPLGKNGLEFKSLAFGFLTSSSMARTTRGAGQPMPMYSRSRPHGWL